MGIERVVSGGQTGVDRAALDVALARGLACGGWCPRGRRAEDGPIDRRYPLRETAGEDPAERTRLNVRDSDGTLIIARGEPTGGTKLSGEMAAELGRPCLRIDPAATDRGAACKRVRRWAARESIGVLNVAGPRESEQPGIGAEAKVLLEDVLPRGDA